MRIRVMPLLLACLLIPTFASADDGIIKLLPPPKAEWKSVTADGPVTTLGIQGDKPAKWELLDDANGAELRASGDGKSATLAASVPGVYRVIAIQGEVVYRSAVTVGTPPTPPAPVPPGPAPVPPAPVDPLLAALQAAYGKETAADKAELVLKKAALYTQAAKALEKDTEIESTGGVIKWLNDAGETLSDDRIPEVRKVARLELAAKLGGKDIPLSAELRASAVDTFKRLGAALAKVK